MGFLHDRKAEAKAAAADGDTDRAIGIVVHALSEGPGTLTENLRDMAQDEN
ncbi:hypothetical protein [Streptomyces halstedii]|uniref:hypothetical protein n=1 Tax=Streptomyces halstedii TaxID=1944 RepID=UPI00382E9AD2